MFHILHPQRLIKRKASVRVKGIGNALSNAVSPIPYRSIVDDGDWTRYFGSSIQEKQRYGNWDTNDCFEFSPIKNIEIQMNALLARGEFPPNAVSFFKSTGILATDGFFNISDQFYDVLSGNLGNGGTAEETCQLIQKYGIIPHDMLYCTDAIASRYSTQQDFDNYYYGMANITQAMRDIGQQSLQYFQLRYQRIGKMWQTPDKTTLSAAIRQALLAYGVPVNVSAWNQTNVPTYVSLTMQHEVTGYKMTQLQVGYPIVDNYNPFIKVLGDGYSINSVIQPVITAIPAPIPIPQSKLNIWQQCWSAVHDYFVKIGIIVPIGGLKPAVAS